MLALLLSLSNPETVGGRKNGSGSHSCYTDQLPSSKYENYFQFLLWSVCSIQIADQSEASKRSCSFRDQSYFVEEYYQENCISSQTRSQLQDTPEILNLIFPYLPEDLKALAKSCENILHLTHDYSFFSVYSPYPSDGVKVYSIFLSTNVPHYIKCHTLNNVKKNNNRNNNHLVIMYYIY